MAINTAAKSFTRASMREPMAAFLRWHTEDMRN